MKNIHIIATDKTSKLQLNVNTKKLILFDNIQSNNESVHLTTQHIYITSDEEIKEGDWCINLNSPYKHKELCRIDNQLELERYAVKIGNNCKKIILTTDPDLIKDGVQAIDDKFLEWFVKNPSCEEVELEVDLSKHNGQFQTKYGFKIIIPKEEPKQEQEVCNHCGKTLREQMKGCGEITCYRQFLSKQETLEEAFKNTYLGEKISFNSDIGKSFEIGANWQKERSYSEEEVLKLLLNSEEYTRFNGRTDLKHWFEQFKKK